MPRKILLAALFLFLACVGLAAGLLAYAQTRGGQDRLAGLLGDLLSGPGRRVELLGLRGSPPFDLRLRALRLADADGVWLEAEDARLTVVASDLLRLALTVRALGAGRVALHRLPAAPEPPPPAEPFSLPELPDLPRSLPAAAVDRVYVDRLELGQPVLGAAAAFGLEGRLGTDGGRAADLRLAVRRLNETTARADIAARLDLAGQTLKLDATGSETGGLLASATGRPEAGDLRVVLGGAGPLGDWRGRLEVAAERLATAGLDLQLAYADRKRLAVTGGADLAPGLLPAAAARAVGPRVDLDLEAQATQPSRIELDRLELRTATASLRAAGGADPASNRVDARVELDAPDLAPLSGLAGVALGGGAKAALAAEGVLDRPRLTLTLSGTNLAAAAATAKSLDASVVADLLAPLTGGPPALDATGRASALGLALDGRELGPGGPLELDLAAALPRTGRIALRRLELRSPLATLTGRGELDRGTLEGSGRLDLAVPDLAAVAAAVPGAPAELGGGLTVGADIDVAPRAEQVDVVLDGGAQALRVPENLAPLVGPAPTWRGRAIVRPAAGVAAHDLALSGAGFRVEGDPSFAFATQALGGGLRLLLPDLAVLSPLAGEAVAGSLEGRVALAGTAAQPDISLDLAGRDLAAAGQRLERARLVATAAGPAPAPAGTARLEIVAGGAGASLATRYALADRRLALDDLVLEAPATRLAGAARVELDGPLATGELAGEVRDLAALRPFTDQPLTGRLSVDLKLAAPGGRQSADLTLDAADVGGDAFRLRGARLVARARDALGTPRLDAKLGARELTGPGYAVAQAELTAAGALDALAIGLASTGDQAGRPFDLRSAATVDAASATRTVRLASLDGGFAGQRLRLTEPAVLRLGADGGIELGRTRLELGPGRLALSGSLAGDRVQADAELEGLDLAALSAFGGPALQGKATAQARLRGTVRAPTATASLRVVDLAADPAAPLKPDLELAASLEGGQLDARLGVAGLGDRPLAATARLPVRLALQPFAFALASDAPLAGRVDGAVDLARAMQFVPAAPGTQVTGDLELALGIDGTVDQPTLSGAIDLDGGAVQDLATGIELRDVALRLEGRGRELALTRLAAVGPAGGTLGGSGRAGLSPNGGVGGLTYDARVDAVGLRVLNNELGRAVISAEVEARGDLAGARVAGTITVDSADIAIPDETGPSVPVLEVREVGPGQAPAAAAPADAAAARPFDLVLDLRVEAPARLFVRGRGLDSEWGGSLTVRGPAASPEIVGALEFRRGFLDLLAKRFEIRRGVISFVGTEPPVPMIDLEAAASTEEIQAVVRLQGPATDTKLELTSEPPLPQDEVLARVLFGSSVDRLTPVQGLRLAAAVDTLRGGGGVSDLLGALRKGLGIDTLDVGGGDTPEESTARAGKYVSDNVYVEVERGVSEGTGKARVQVDLTPNLSVTTEVDEQSQTGVGLQWRYDY